MTALLARRAGLLQRDIAVLLWGEAAVAGTWERDSWMRSRLRRRLAKAHKLMTGYRDIAAGR